MEIIGLIETLESRINSYWNFYTVVVFANAGWVFSSFGSLSFKIALLLSVGLMLFFISNLSFQRVALDNLAAARNELVAKKELFEHKLLFERYSTEKIPYRRQGTYILHITVDVILIITIFLGVE
jgi:hypothetical protein